jgi:4'-phosphopantetheinyl transferase
MLFLDGLEDWDGTVPAVWISPTKGREERIALLRRMAARVLRLGEEWVGVEGGGDLPFTLSKPKGSGITLSSASRGELTALAVARQPIGVDVEAVDLAAPVPWRVLHPSEAGALQTLQGRAQASAFARLWSLKECYLKALGIGLSREPSSFAVHFTDGQRARIEDTVQRVLVAEAQTTWRASAGTWLAISAIALEPRSAAAAWTRPNS